MSVKKYRRSEPVAVEEFDCIRVDGTRQNADELARLFPRAVYSGQIDATLRPFNEDGGRRESVLLRGKHGNHVAEYEVGALVNLSTGDSEYETAAGDCYGVHPCDSAPTEMETGIAEGRRMEREAIVAWLRLSADKWASEGLRAHAASDAWVADAIERGEHEKGSGE